MDDEKYLFHIFKCVNAVKRAIEDDEAFGDTHSRRREDGLISWSTAARHFSKICGHDMSATDLQHLYYEHLNLYSK